MVDARMIKYLGSKRLLVPRIVDVVERLPDVRTVLDFFAGTSRVGLALKQRGLRVLANDHNAYAATLARCYVQADAEDVLERARRLVDELNGVRGDPGWFTATYCERARYFHPRNGARIEAIRARIAALDLEPELEAVALTALMEAADRVDSTIGVQMAYLKQWAPRALNDLHLRVPEVAPRARGGKGSAHELDALVAARELAGDVAYLDPPYNRHSYVGNYHVWETLVRWDRPDVYGVACKRTDVRDRISPFNSKRRFRPALEELIRGVRARHLVVSFSNEGCITRDELVALLSARGRVHVVGYDHKRHVGAQIGIHGPHGRKVGSISHLRNTEHLFVVTDAPFQSPGER